MIISRTPLRFSFFGGGSDFPEFYQKFGGAVVSTTIDKFIYLSINKRFSDDLRFSYSETEIVLDATELQHTLAKNCLLHFGIKNCIELTSVADIHGHGSGLGSSSAFSVGLINLLSCKTGKKLSKHQMAETAFHVERNVCGNFLGVQDQYAASFGGLNLFTFSANGVETSKIDISTSSMKQIESCCMLFYTGNTRSASAVLSDQFATLRKGNGDEFPKEKEETLKYFASLAQESVKHISEGNVEWIGRYLNECWNLKRRLGSLVSTGEIDNIYLKAKAAGALGGKLLGAGGGGFMLFVVPLERQAKVREALIDLKEMPILFEQNGSEIIYNDEV